MDAPAKPDARAGSATAGVLPLLVGILALLAFFFLQRVPRERLLAPLEQKPILFMEAAGLMLLPVLLFGFIDYSRASQKTYEPPSLRVQVARALAYAFILAVANVLLFLWMRPDLLRVLIGLGRRATLLSVLVIPYGVGAWVVCFRRREFIAPELASFRDACAALRDTYDFVLGRTFSDWKTGTGDPSWYILPERALYANLYTLGGIGSGKTSSVVKPLVEQALFKFSKDVRKKVSVFMLDAKGNNAEYMLERARAAGREKDVVIIRPGGEWSYNPLGSGSPTAVANKLVQALEVMTAQESNSYYKKMQREFAENAIQVLGDVLGAGKVSMMDLYNFICDPAYQRKILDAAAPTNSIAYRWFINQWLTEDPREQKMLTKGFRADLSSFVRDDMAPTFACSDPNFPGWENLIDAGKIVVFSMSLDEYGDFARAMGIFVLMDFQSVMLARTTTKFRKAGHNVDRLVLCVIDEVWAYMNEKLAEFTSVSREARCCTLALHQSLGQIPEKYRQVVIGNFRTPVILAINDPLSLQTFSQIFGEHRVFRESRSESAGFAGVERQLLTDSLRGRIGGESRSVSVSRTQVDEARFSQDDILRLGKNRAVVQMFDGDTTSQPRVVETLPGYKPEFQLG